MTQFFRIEPSYSTVHTVALESDAVTALEVRQLLVEIN